MRAGELALFTLITVVAIVAGALFAYTALTHQWVASAVAGCSLSLGLCAGALILL